MKSSNLFFKIIIFIAIPYLTFNCSSNEDLELLNQENYNSPVTSEDDFLIGKWIVTEISVTGNITMDDKTYDWGWVFSNLPFQIESKIEIQNYTVNFSKKPNIITTEGGISASYTSTIDDYLYEYEFSKDLENIGFFNQGNWFLENNAINTTNNKKYESYFIQEYSRDKLEIVKSISDGLILTSTYYPYTNFKSTANLSVLITLQKKI